MKANIKILKVIIRTPTWGVYSKHYTILSKREKYKIMYDETITFKCIEKELEKQQPTRRYTLRCGKRYAEKDLERSLIAEIHEYKMNAEEFVRMIRRCREYTSRGGYKLVLKNLLWRLYEFNVEERLSTRKLETILKMLVEAEHPEIVKSLLTV